MPTTQNCLDLTQEINRCKKIMGNVLQTNEKKVEAAAVRITCNILLAQMINEMTDQGHVQNISIKI